MSGKECALKIINRAKVFGREDIVENELKIMRSVNHPNIIKLIEDFETTDETTLVMELLQGGDLFDAIVHCHHLTKATCKRITRYLGHALLYLHGKRIVHQDIKPENIFVEISVNPDGSHSLKLGDFGMATIVTEPLSLVCGTPCYTAPEMLLETGYGVKVDIWACGVICYIMLCGILPFGSQKNTIPVIYENIKRGMYSFSVPIWDTILAEAKDLVTLML